MSCTASIDGTAVCRSEVGGHFERGQRSRVCRCVSFEVLKICTVAYRMWQFHDVDGIVVLLRDDSRCILGRKDCC